MAVHINNGTERKPVASHIIRLGHAHINLFAGCGVAGVFAAALCAGAIMGVFTANRLTHGISVFGLHAVWLKACRRSANIFNLCYRLLNRYGSKLKPGGFFAVYIGYLIGYLFSPF